MKDLLAAYIGKNEIFADLYNNYFSRGQSSIDVAEIKNETKLEAALEEELESMEVNLDDIGKVVVKSDDKGIYILFALYDQNELTKNMPMICMMSEFFAYKYQKEHKREKFLPADAFVMYVGVGEWKGPKSTQEMFGKVETCD